MLSRLKSYSFKELITRTIICLVCVGFILALLLAFWTRANLNQPPHSLRGLMSSGSHVQVLDRSGVPLNTTYQNRWNIHDTSELHDIPQFLRTAFILSEDKRFYDHNGPDWTARISALFTNIKSGRAIRGASTISEQTIRMIYPRPRTLKSRWLEGFDAHRLERDFNKDEIFEFYLNQVPYAANRRGVAQAAHYYFNRDLATLSQKEMLALTVLVRAPSYMDLWKDTGRVEGRIKSLADQLVQAGHLTPTQRDLLLEEKLSLEAPRRNLDASSFVRHVKLHFSEINLDRPKLRSSLDANLQNYVQALLDTRLRDLKSKNVANAAVLVVDHQTGEILTWAVGGSRDQDTPGRLIDTVTTRRQPGSALKPFLYSLALEKGWSAATMIHDGPLIESVGHGLHSYQNYSREFYGPVTLRQALGNSLNIPALKTLQFVGAESYLDYLAEFGFEALSAHPNFYGDGIALGNGEVSLFELVQAYTVLANGGLYKEISAVPDAHRATPRRVMPRQVASLMGNILSDRQARKLEFGEYSILNFPIQTAVKTGTSNDYRDSWAVGFNHRYTAGIWMGNLDQTPTDGVTGSTGPALLLRSIFAHLSKYDQTRPLYLDPTLISTELCQKTHEVKQAGDRCETYVEWFTKDTKPSERIIEASTQTPIRMRRPVNGLHIAYDPRVPTKDQAFEFYIQGLSNGDIIDWTIDNEQVTTKTETYLWPIEKGEHFVEATIHREGEEVVTLKKVRFLVK